MTIEEFMEDIAPKMRPGWVAMSQKGDWWYYPDEPLINTAIGHWHRTGDKLPNLLSGFDISPVDDWTQSLRKVGELCAN